MVDTLLNLDATDIPADEPGRRLLADKIAGMSAKPVGQVIVGGGWIGEPGHRFAFRGRVIGSSARKETIAVGGEDVPNRFFLAHTFDYQALANVVDEYPAAGVGVFNESGTEEAWEDSVARPAAYSSLAITLISGAFLAPLLAYFDLPTVCLVAIGPTSIGKTTALRSAGSTCGQGSEESIADWNLTETHLEELAVHHRDAILVIDDMGTARGSPKDQYNLIRHATFVSTRPKGRGRSRGAQAALTGGTGDRSPARAVILSSSEKSMAEMALAANSRKDGGQDVRFIEIPACMPGSEGIFDRLPDHIPAGERKAFAAQLADKLKEGARLNQGIVFASYLRFLTNRFLRKRYLGIATSHMDSFLKRARPKTSVQFRHAKIFAALYGAASLAVHLGHVPWSQEEAKDAIWTTYKASRAQLPDPDEEIREDVASFDRWLDQKAKIDAWPDGAGKADPEADGWVREIGGEEYIALRRTRAADYFGESALRQILQRLVMDERVRLQDGQVSKQARVPGLIKRPNLCHIKRGSN